MSNVRDFLMSSDHQMDKIIYFKEIFVPVSNKQDSLNIDTGLPFCPLVFGVWSTTPDFTVCQPFIQGGMVSPRTGDFVTESVSILANMINGDSSIILSSHFNSVHSYYVRIYGFMPTDQDFQASITSNHAQKMMLSSDFNYRKLAIAGVLPYTVDIVGYKPQASTITINHNLGYLPQAMVWLETSFSDSPNDKDIIPFEFSQQGTDFAPNGEVILTNSSVIITPLAGQWGDTFRAHYRIYYDEA